MKIKSTNGLMKYLRDKKGIAITGSSQKRKLRNIGYYHGYKGYRFFRNRSKCLNYTNFDELMAVYNFDMQVKSILYPQLMFIETALKNYALEVFLETAKSEKFVDIYNQVLNHHHDISPTLKDNYKNALKAELAFRSRVYGDLARDYNSRLLVQHFYERDKPVPVWAIFETLSLGEFGNMLRCVNDQVMQRISASLGINSSFNSDGRLLEKIVYTLKDLRNAVAHNDPVFDIRFYSASPNKRIGKLLAAEMGVQGVDFTTIVDYIVLSAYLLKLVSVSKTDIKRFVSSFVTCYEDLRKKVPISIFSTIIHTDTRNKIKALLQSL